MMVDSSTRKPIPPKLQEVLAKANREMAKINQHPETQQKRLREAKRLEAMAKQKPKAEPKAEKPKVLVEPTADANPKLMGEVSEEETAELEAQLKALLDADPQQFKAYRAYDDELTQIGTKYAFDLITRGIITFPDFRTKMIEILGEKVEPYIAMFYMGVTLHPKIVAKKLPVTPAHEVASFLEDQSEGGENTETDAPLETPMSSTDWDAPPASVDPPSLADGLAVWKKWRSSLQASPGRYGRGYNTLLSQANQVIEWKETGVFPKPE